MEKETRPNFLPDSSYPIARASRTAAEYDAPSVAPRTDCSRSVHQGDKQTHRVSLSPRLPVLTSARVPLTCARGLSFPPARSYPRNAFAILVTLRHAPTPLSHSAARARASLSSPPSPADFTSHHRKDVSPYQYVRGYVTCVCVVCYIGRALASFMIASVFYAADRTRRKSNEYAQTLFPAFRFPTNICGRYADE